VEVQPEHRERFEELFKGTAFALIGEVIEESLLRFIGLQGQEIIRESIEELKASWQRTLFRPTES
jgi:phosphoribosylformylglycinamidine synthase